MINAAFGSFLVTYQRNTCKTKGRKGRRIKIGVDKLKGMMSCVSFVPHFKLLEFQNAVKEDREVLNRIKCNTNGKMLLPGNGKRANSQLFGPFSTPRDCSPSLHKAADTGGTPLPQIPPGLGFPRAAPGFPTGIPFSLSCSRVTFCKITNSDSN